MIRSRFFILVEACQEYEVPPRHELAGAAAEVVGVGERLQSTVIIVSHRVSQFEAAVRTADHDFSDEMAGSNLDAPIRLLVCWFDLLWPY